MKLLSETTKFIFSKWDISELDVLYPIGKVLLYIPCIINNILNQLLYFSIFPFVMYYVYFKKEIEDLMKKNISYNIDDLI